MREGLHKIVSEAHVVDPLSLGDPRNLPLESLLESLQKEKGELLMRLAEHETTVDDRERIGLNVVRRYKNEGRKERLDSCEEAYDNWYADGTHDMSYSMVVQQDLSNLDEELDKMMKIFLEALESDNESDNEERRMFINEMRAAKKEIERKELQKKEEEMRQLRKGRKHRGPADPGHRDLVLLAKGDPLPQPLGKDCRCR